MFFRLAYFTLFISLAPFLIISTSYADETRDCGTDKFITLPNPFVLKSADLNSLEECRSGLIQALNAYITPVCSEIRSQQCGLPCVAECHMTNPPPIPVTPPPGKVGFSCGSEIISSPSGMISLSPCRITFKSNPKIAVRCRSTCAQMIDPDIY